MNAAYAALAVSLACLALVALLFRAVDGATVKQPWITVAAAVPVDVPPGDRMQRASPFARDRPYWVLVDPAAYRMTRAATACELARREFELLQTAYRAMPPNTRASRVPLLHGLPALSGVQFAERAPAASARTEVVGETTFVYVARDAQNAREVVVAAVAELLAPGSPAAQPAVATQLAKCFAWRA